MATNEALILSPETSRKASLDLKSLYNEETAGILTYTNPRSPARNAGPCVSGRLSIARKSLGHPLCRLSRLCRVECAVDEEAWIRQPSPG
jgi:hypothetical protein